MSDIDGMVIGGHSDKGMLPLTRLATRNSVRVSEFLSKERLLKVLEDTKVGGSTFNEHVRYICWYACGKFLHWFTLLHM